MDWKFGAKPFGRIFCTPCSLARDDYAPSCSGHGSTPQLSWPQLKANLTVLSCRSFSLFDSTVEELALPAGSILGDRPPKSILIHAKHEHDDCQISSVNACTSCEHLTPSFYWVNSSQCNLLEQCVCVSSLHLYATPLTLVWLKCDSKTVGV